MDRTFSNTLAALGQKGLRYGTVIDVGCADGQFFVDHYLQGLFQESVPLNIDANWLYEPSLRAIQETFGGSYFIGAASDQSGEVEMTMAVHPYWSSLRSRTDPYWNRINKLWSHVQRVSMVLLDDLVTERDLRPPFLLKLDVQGSEVQALRGAVKILADTSAVICEADIADFQSINSELVGAGFDLYDITVIRRLADQSLGWFYPVYLSNRLGHIRSRNFWRDSSNQRVIDEQIARREQILAWLAEVLPQIRATRTPRKRS